MTTFLAAYQSAVVLLAVFVIGMLVGAWLLSAYIRWCDELAQLGCYDPSEPTGYVDQDGERTPARHQWRNAGMKAHHAE